MDHVEHAFRQVQLLINDLEDTGLGHGHLLRGLNNICIPCNNSVGKEPIGDHGRKVKRCDAPEDTHRHSFRVAINVVRDVFHGVAGHDGGHARGMLQILDHPPHLTP